MRGWGWVEVVGLTAAWGLTSFTLDHKVSVEPTLCQWGQVILTRIAS